MIQKPKGTNDVYGEVSNTWKYLINYINNFMSLYNYTYVKTPTFESTELFKRGVGETTDIVNKETYDFLDKSNRPLTLRPEFTAGVSRMFIENKLYSNEINKFYYLGSCFRYERPQSGRYREFTQFGVEFFGSNLPLADTEIISLCYRFLTSLGIENIVVKINSIGSSKSKEVYNKELKKYLETNINSLCETCQERYKTNILRILDCKIDKESDILKNAPKPLDYLTTEDKDLFESVKENLDNLSIPYVIDDSLVRGLDYYTNLVFELEYDSKNLGPESVICGGGRYNNLIENLGGPEVPAVGFSIGIERLINMIESENIIIPNIEIDAFVINIDATKYAYSIVDELRNNGYIIETDYLNKTLKSQFKLVDKYNPKFIIICGGEEEKNNVVTIKDNVTKDEVKIERNKVIEYFNINI